MYYFVSTNLSDGNYIREVTEAECVTAYRRYDKTRLYDSPTYRKSDTLVIKTSIAATDLSLKVVPQ